MAVAGVRHLNQVNFFVANLQIATAWNTGRQIRRIGTAQHFAAFAIGFHPQRNPKLDVRAHLIGHAGWSLRRQNQRNALSAAQPRDHFQLGFVFSPISDHFSEFINNNK